MKSARFLLWLFVFMVTGHFALANLPGGGPGTNFSTGVTLTDSGTEVILSNGIVAIRINKSGGDIDQINYTFNNTGTSQTLNLVAGNPNTGRLYWEDANDEGLTFSYNIVTNPASNNGNYGEVVLTTTSVPNILVEIHYSMLRGSSGFYVTPIWFHRSTDGAFTNGECRDNIYAGSIFNWMSVDAARNRLMEVSGGSAIGVQGAPVEVSLWTNGIYSGQYEDKYKYSADFGYQQVYGWSSVGTGGQNVGIWNIQPSMEYHQGGPLKRDLMEHIGTTILNMLNSSHYGGNAVDDFWGAGEVWTKVYGPYFIYCNSITNTNTVTYQAAQSLYADAQLQALAEEGVDTNGQPTGALGAWPYYWMGDTNYAQASGRGAVSGHFVINDTYNTNASAAGLWVGVMQQPVTVANIYDFQVWMKNYQFWVKTDTNGNFTIPNVIAGANYTLYAFGPGAAGTFQSQNLTGGNSPNTRDVPASPFSVTVTAGATNNLGTVTWTPTRVGPTVFEIGYPSRTGQNKFKHGDDYWVSEIYSNPKYPSPVWGKFLEYPFDFPSGPNYFVGQSRWTTDWNYVQPCVVSSSGLYNDSSSTITFNLASTPSGTASVYLALCSDYQGAVEIAVNGTQVAGANGYSPNYSSSGSECDTTIREGINADFSDNRTSFSASLLHSGQNTIVIDMRQTGKVNGNGYFADHAMYDYIRLELTGYIPPPPTSVAAYAGNGTNLVCWPVTPGAVSYNIFRTTTSGTGYSLIASGVTGPVCGSGANNATYLDTNSVINGTTYYYVVQSANTVGSSANSPQSSGVTPSASLSASAPNAPASVFVTGVGHQAVDINWSASPGANYYSVFRSTWFNNGGGASNLLGTILLNNGVTTTSYSDDTPTDGSIYSYFVTATSAGGTSSNSPAVVAVPVPAPPASAPAGLSGNVSQGTNAVLNWSSVSGAVGYVISRATNFNGPYILRQSVTETTYTDSGLKAGNYYYFQVNAVNAAGVSGTAATTVIDPNAFVTNLNDNGSGSLRQAVASLTSSGLIAFNTSLSGGAILLSNGPIILSNNVVIDASPLAHGIQINGKGASSIFIVTNTAAATLYSLMITNGSSPDYGGGIQNYSTVTLSNSIVANNTAASRGGGIASFSGTVTLNNSTVANNSSPYGGGIFNSSTLTLNNSTLANNSAPGGGGGGLANYGPATLNNSTVAGNVSSEAPGGGIENFSALVLVNSTVASNSATGSPGGGIYGPGGTVTMTNSILSGNSAISFSDLDGSYAGPSNLVGVASIGLAPLGNYGGPTMTMPPLAGSPAIDAGVDSVTSFLTTDQRGYPRKSGAHVDIGAVEAQIASSPLVIIGTNGAAATFQASHGQAQINFTNLAGGSFTVYASTNPAAPFNAWSNLGTVVESPIGSGRFQFSDPQATTNFPQRFYILTSP
jgi:hypothetical protein